MSEAIKSASVVLCTVLLGGCEAQPPPENKLKELAETYECTSAETDVMVRYFEMCNTGMGYFAGYCLDRAAIACCHRVVIDSARSNRE